MSLKDYENLSNILKQKNINEDRIKKIMIDVKKSKIFEEDKFIDENYDKWLILEQKSNIIFGDIPSEEKVRKLKYINDINQRILEKTKEVEEKLGKRFSIGTKVFTNKYGRTPLHDAICNKNINFVIECANSKDYINCVDNSGHTPLECAYYYCFPEAIDILIKVV